MDQYNGSIIKQRIKYFMYARKSTESEDRQVASIESQIGELRKIAAANGLEIVEEMSEAKSAKAPGRPVFTEMIKRIDKGEAQGIICWKLDRLARNPIDGGTISWMLQQGKLLHIQTYERAYWPTDNVLMMSVEFGMANQYVRDLSTNVKRELRRKAAMGWRPGKAPPGYLNTPEKEKGKKVITKDTELFPLVRRMFEMVMDGTHSAPAVWRMATNDWGFRMHSGHKMTLSNFYWMLRSPFYYGVYEYPTGSGNWHQGNHPAMLTKAEYEKVQEHIRARTTTRPHDYDFPYRGFIHCGECGASVTAEHKRRRLNDGTVRTHTYYHCTRQIRNKFCSQKTSITERELKEQIEQIVSGLELSPAFCDWALDILRGEHTKETDVRSSILEQRRKSYDACVKKLDKLLELRISDGIDDDSFTAKKVELVKEKAVLANLIADSDRRIDNWFSRAEEIFNFAKTARASFENGNYEKKREILSLLGTNWTLRDGKVSLTFDEPIRHLAHCAALANGKALPQEKPAEAQLPPATPRIGKYGMKRRTKAEVAQDMRHRAKDMPVRGALPDYLVAAHTLAIRKNAAGADFSANTPVSGLPTESGNYVRSAEVAGMGGFAPNNEAARRRETGEPRHNIPKILRD